MSVNRRNPVSVVEMESRFSQVREFGIVTVHFDLDGGKAVCGCRLTLGVGGIL